MSLSRKVAVLASTALLLSACGHGANPQPSASLSSASPSSSPSSSAGLGGGAGEGSSAPRSTIITTPKPTLSTGAKGSEIDKPCPYASTDDFRDAEGDRTVRSVQLAGNPVGCRYYFAYDPAEIIGEITIQTFATSTQAFNAVVTAAKGHPEAYGDKSIGDGAVLLKLPLQGVDTWACVFAKGKRVVTAHTRQTTVAQDAKNVAVLIEPRVP
ncbi:MAG: hypothetical protein QOK10_1932 [Pseudonocardiales bacterium]|nr:hypothetical protein [Pseudonocardiales bacterium]